MPGPKEIPSPSVDYRAQGGKPSVAVLIAVVCAFALTAALAFGYLYLRRRHASQLQVTASKTERISQPALPPVVQVYEDEAKLRGSQAVIGGTIQNISSEKLSDLSVQLQLIHRADSHAEVRTVAVTPSILEPDQQGRYALLLAREFSQARLISVTRGADASALAFRTSHGAARAPERPTQNTTTTTIIKRPTPRAGDDFINTPDNPSKIP